MNTLKATVCAFFGACGTAIAGLFGGWTGDMTTLIIVMAIDFIMGLLIAAVFKKSDKSESGTLNSKSCFRGLCKKCTMLLFVLIASRLDMTLGVEYIKGAVIIAFITNELISIIENAGIMGIPMPEIILKAIDLLKNKTEKC